MGQEIYEVDVSGTIPSVRLTVTRRIMIEMEGLYTTLAWIMSVEQAREIRDQLDTKLAELCESEL